MVDGMSVKTALSQIDNVQRVQQVRQKEGDVQQKQFHSQLVQHAGEQLKQVTHAPPAEHAEVREREGRGGTGGGRREGRRDTDDKAEHDNVDERGSVVDIKV